MVTDIKHLRPILLTVAICALIITAAAPLYAMAADNGGQINVYNALPGEKYAILDDKANLIGMFETNPDSTAAISLPEGNYTIIRYNDFLSFGVYTDGARAIEVKQGMTAFVDFDDELNMYEKNNRVNSNETVPWIAWTSFIVCILGVIVFGLIQAQKVKI